MQKMIVALDRDGIETRLLTIVVDILSDGIDLREAVRNACTEYCKTEEGKKVYEDNCNSFNWGDFELHVPNSICEKHGFVKVSMDMQDDEFDFNEQLVNEFDIFEDKE